MDKNVNVYEKVEIKKNGSAKDFFNVVLYPHLD